MSVNRSVTRPVRCLQPSASGWAGRPRPPGTSPPRGASGRCAGSLSGIKQPATDTNQPAVGFTLPTPGAARLQSKSPDEVRGHGDHKAPSGPDFATRSAAEPGKGVIRKRSLRCARFALAAGVCYYHYVGPQDRKKRRHTLAASAEDRVWAECHWDSAQPAALESDQGRYQTRRRKTASARTALLAGRRRLLPAGKSLSASSARSFAPFDGSVVQ